MYAGLVYTVALVQRKKTCKAFKYAINWKQKGEVYAYFCSGLKFCFNVRYRNKYKIYVCKLILCLLLKDFFINKILFFSSPEHEVLKWAFVILQCPASGRPCVRPCVRASTISLNNISSETAYWILTKLHRNDPWVVLYQSCSNRFSWLHK